VLSVTSLKNSMSTYFSASSFFRRTFSFSNSLRRFASLVLIPPYRFLTVVGSLADAELSGHLPATVELEASSCPPPHGACG